MVGFRTSAPMAPRVMMPRENCPAAPMQGGPMSQGAPSPYLLIANHHRETNEVMECMLWLRGVDAESVETLAAAEAHLRVKQFALLICRNAMPDGVGTDFI